MTFTPSISNIFNRRGVPSFNLYQIYKEFVGISTNYENGDVTIEMEEGVTKTFTKADVALVRLTFDF